MLVQHPVKPVRLNERQNLIRVARARSGVFHFWTAYIIEETISFRITSETGEDSPMTNRTNDAGHLVACASTNVFVIGCGTDDHISSISNKYLAALDGSRRFSPDCVRDEAKTIDEMF